MYTHTLAPQRLRVTSFVHYDSPALRPERGHHQRLAVIFPLRVYLTSHHCTRLQTGYYITNMRALLRQQGHRFLPAMEQQSLLQCATRVSCGHRCCTTMSKGCEVRLKDKQIWTTLIPSIVNFVEFFNFTGQAISEYVLICSTN